MENTPKAKEESKGAAQISMPSREMQGIKKCQYLQRVPF